MFFLCTGSDFACVSRQPPIPGLDDFPQIISRQHNAGAFYYTYDEMAVTRFQQFKILNETFNDTRWWQTFTLPIYVDDVPEGVEEFNLSLSLLPDPNLPPRAVNITPAVATVRIQDCNCKFGPKQVFVHSSFSINLGFICFVCVHVGPFIWDKRLYQTQNAIL